MLSTESTLPQARAAAAALLVTLATTAGALPLALPAHAQDSASDAEGASSIEIPVEHAVTGEHTVTIEGEQVPYTATTGTLPVYDDDGRAIASIFYTYYQRSDVENRARRPLTFSFNGGPGSASVWMHIGYTGPRLVRIDDEGFPIQPYGFEENPHSILDATDIVYVNPVNTGFSRALEGVETEQFFGVDNDIEYLAAWIERFVSRHDRWASPKFLIGESYGTTRVSGLADELQGSHWMFLNGVILVSPTGLGIDRGGPVGDALLLPHYAATAWYHGQLPTELQSRDLEELLPEVETFTLDEYIPALARGGFLDEGRRAELARTVARYAGVSETFVLNNNLS
ncbi:MAG: S10 family peptidase, partial [Gemmatimonadota bacterium]